MAALEVSNIITPMFQIKKLRGREVTLGNLSEVTGHKVAGPGFEHKLSGSRV